MSTPRISLEALALQHGDSYAALLSDSETAKYITEEDSFTHADAIAKLRHIIERNTANADQVYLAIVSEPSQKFIGYVAAHKTHSQVCPISYAVLPLHRRKGLGRTAVTLLLHYLAQNTDIEFAEALTHPQNTASAATLKACEFNFEGSLTKQAQDRHVYRKPIKS